MTIFAGFSLAFGVLQEYYSDADNMRKDHINGNLSSIAVIGTTATVSSLSTTAIWLLQYPRLFSKHKTRGFCISARPSHSTSSHAIPTSAKPLGPSDSFSALWRTSYPRSPLRSGSSSSRRESWAPLVRACSSPLRRSTSTSGGSGEKDWLTGRCGPGRASWAR